MIDTIISWVKKLTELKSALGGLVKKKKKQESQAQTVVHGNQTNNNVEGNQTIYNITNYVVTGNEDLAKHIGGNPNPPDIFILNEKQPKPSLKSVTKETTNKFPLPGVKVEKQDKS